VTVVGIAEPGAELRVVPNPAHNVIYVHTPSAVLSGTVTDITGRIVLGFETQTAVDVSRLEAGTYLVSVQTASGVLKTKFVKQ
jgi:hypothetical protein